MQRKHQPRFSVKRGYAANAAALNGNAPATAPGSLRIFARMAAPPPQNGPDGERPDPTAPGFFSRCEDPTPEEICIAALATSLRGMVKRGAVSQSAADRQLNEYRQRREREPFGPAPQDSVAEPDDKRHTAQVVRGNARTLRETAAALDALGAGEPPESVKIPPGVIIDPTREQIAEECRRFGLRTIPKNGWCGAVFMSVAMLSRVWKNSQSRLGDRLVLLALADFANDAGEAWPSVETLAKKSRLSKRETQYALRRLERSGELKTLPGRGPRGCNVYRITAAEGAQYLQGRNICTDAVYDKGGAVYNTQGAQGTAPKPSENRKEPSGESIAELAQLTPLLAGASAGDPLSPASLSSVAKKPRHGKKDSIAGVATAWGAQRNLPAIRNLSDKRRKVIATRLQDDFFARHYEEAIGKVAASAFCRGENERRWRADFDWFLKPDSVTRIIEGKYDDGAPARGDLPANLVVPEPGRPTVAEANRAAWERKMKERAEREAAEAEHSP